MTTRRIENNQTANHEIHEGAIESNPIQRSDGTLSNLAGLSGDLPQPLPNLEPDLIQRSDRTLSNLAGLSGDLPQPLPNLEPDLTQRSDRTLSNLADLSAGLSRDLPQPLYCETFDHLPSLNSITSLSSLPDFIGHNPFETLYQRITQSKTSSLTYEEQLLRSIPEGATEFIMNGSDILVLPKLPISITHIDLNRFYSLTKIKDLPQRLKFLKISQCEKFTNLPVLPLSLEELYLYDCKNLEELPDFPEKLEKLTLNGCKKIEQIPKLPKGIKELDLSNCLNLRELPELPSGLRELNLSNCSNLRELPELPSGLLKLDLSNCSNLRELPELPSGLRELNLSNCSNLRELPELPSGLLKLDLSGCNNLSIESVLKLQDLEEKNRNNPNFQLIWPSNISKKIISLSIVKKAYQRYYSSNPDFSERDPDVLDAVNYPTLVLFNRFTSESLGSRGQDDVLISAIEVAKQILKNPEILEILNIKSAHYLQACINQPVSGFSEIASLMAIVNEENIAKKIEKAKILNAQQLIKNNIRNLINSDGQRVGIHVEVELGNAMLREVYKELTKEELIKEPWPGIPENIANERLIESFLTPQNIKKMTDLVKEALLDIQKSQKNAIDFLCGVETNFWAKTILTKEEQEKAQPEAYLKAQQKRIEELREEIIDLDLSQTALISQKNKELEEIEKDIENKRLTNLSDLLKQKTQELLRQKPLLLQRLAFAKPMEVMSTTTSETYFIKSEKNKKTTDSTDLTNQGRRYDPAGGAFYDRSQDQSYFDNDCNKAFLFHRNSLDSLQYEKSLHGFRSQTNPSSLPAITENEIMSSSGSQNSQLINSHIDNQTSELINPDGNNQSLRLRSLSAKAGSQHQSPDGISADLVFIEKIPKLDQAKSSPLTRVPIRQTATRIESLTADFVYLPKK